MARYPELRTLFRRELSPEQEEVLAVVEGWAAELIRELDLRDTEVNASPPSNIYTVTSIGLVAKPMAGDVGYDITAGKFKGYVSTGATQAWENFN